MPNDLHSLIPLEDFKAILGLDDREDVLSRYCLITATYTIEQYCKRRLLRWKNADYLTFTGKYIFSLREYQVCKVLTLHAVTTGSVQRGEALFGPENLVDPKHYYSPMKVSMRIYPSRWSYGPLFGFQKKKWGYGYGIWRATFPGMLRLIWPPLALNWRPGT
jgi:hypothetical protein